MRGFISWFTAQTQDVRLATSLLFVAVFLLGMIAMGGIVLVWP